jgi:hypothetical protein
VAEERVGGREKIESSEPENVGGIERVLCLSRFLWTRFGTRGTRVYDPGDRASRLSLDV